MDGDRLPLPTILPGVGGVLRGIRVGYERNSLTTLEQARLQVSEATPTAGLGAHIGMEGAVLVGNVGTACALDHGDHARHSRSVRLKPAG